MGWGWNGSAELRREGVIKMAWGGTAGARRLRFALLATAGAGRASSST
jgi:hypothetical protein